MRFAWAATVLTALLATDTVCAQIIVRLGPITFTEDKSGWLVSKVTQEESVVPLREGDLLTEIDGRLAANLGPLAVYSLLDSAGSRVILLTVRRNGTDERIKIGPDVASGSTPDRTNPAPDFQLKTPEGKTLELSAFRGRWVLVSFWGTWCGPCRAEAPVLSGLATTYRDKLAVLGLAVNDDRQNIEKFVQETHPKYTILLAGRIEDRVAHSYGVGSVPLNVLIRPNGQIAYVESGSANFSELESNVRTFVSAP